MKPRIRVSYNRHLDVYVYLLVWPVESNTWYGNIEDVWQVWEECLLPIFQALESFDF